MNYLQRFCFICFTIFILTRIIGPPIISAQPQSPGILDGAEYASVALDGKGANIRTEPSLKSKVLRAVPPGYPLHIIKRQGEWVQVEDYLARTGWVFANLLADPETVVIKVTRGNLRREPSLSSGVGATLDQNTILKVLEARGDWLQVSNSGGANGWLHGDLVWPDVSVRTAGNESGTAGEAAPAPEQAAQETIPSNDTSLPPKSVELILPKVPEKEQREVLQQVQPNATDEIQGKPTKEATPSAMSATAGNTPVPSTTRGDDYRIGPSDVLSVSIFAGGEKEIGEDVTVSPDGQITLPLLGGIQAAGKTVGELRKDSIEPEARQYFVEPQVTVTIKEYHSLSFYISGSVVHPGHYELDKEPSLLELIAKAGGLEPDYGHKAYILRASHSAEGDADKPIVVDMKDLLDQGDMSKNIRLATGDVIHIPRDRELNQASNSIFVEGEVKKPGIYTFQQGITALSACILAGGFNDYAAPNRARIIRRNGTEQQIIELNLDAVKKGKAKDVELQPGDLVHIPDSWL